MKTASQVSSQQRQQRQPAQSPVNHRPESQSNSSSQGNSRSNGPGSAGLFRNRAPLIQVNNQPATAINRSEILSVDEKISTVQRRCRFFSTAIKQMQSRFNFDDEVYDIAEFFYPVNARSCKPPSLAFLRFPFLRDSCDIIKADAEWRTQRSLSNNLFGAESNDEIKILRYKSTGT
ncbi:hypothetical protein OUZ56_029585 [Daphnia magna]|uniref:Uncharacterized protein n=1 Tax=Daphnia magna TaxID=35525 RepID=A0ABR0B786_9CRUS|nr:hypothetical protein OUZ56_029585 [Daphnia magna]